MCTPLRLSLILLALVSACRDGTEPARPTTISLSSDSVSGPAGLPLAVAPTFSVLDQHGGPMSGVPVAVSVAGGGGTLADAPTVSSAGPLPVGRWTLGARAGLNELLVAVEGVQPARIAAIGVPGPPARLSTPDGGLVVGQVGTRLEPGVRATLADAFDNPVADALVTVDVSGGTAPRSVRSEPDGGVTVSDWVLGTARGAYTMTLTAGEAALTVTARARSGPPAALELVSGGSQAAAGGTRVPRPIRIAVRDTFGNPADSVRASFTVVTGGGSLGATSATSDFDGVLTLPDWTLGRTAVPQRVRATVGTLSLEIDSRVQTAYDLEIRFFGPEMSVERQAHFTRAAERLGAAVIGDLAPAQAVGLDLSVCGVNGVARLDETIDDLIVYANIAPIDGPGKILASAGPCFIRSGRGLPVIGVMQFDEADIRAMEQQAILGDVILHEMLHVLGVGIGLYWDPFLTDKGTSTVAYVGSGARDGCRDSEGTLLCAVSVPVENTGGTGTRDSHWRESSFASELMTGFVDLGGMPLSLITLGTLADLGYQVNPHARDAYTVPGLGMRAAAAGVSLEIVDRILQPAFEIDRYGAIRSLAGRREVRE